MPTDSVESEPTVCDPALADSATFAWSHTPADSRLLRGLVALSVGVVAGFALGIALGAVGLVVLLAVEGRYLLAVATLLAFTLGLARTAPHLFATSESALPFRGLGRRTLAASAVGGLALLALAGSLLPRELFSALVGATLLVPLLLASLLAPEGELDAENGRLTYSGTDIDLSTLAGVRRWSVGGYVAYRLSYAEGAATFATPRTLVVPRRVDSRLRDALDSGVAAESDDPGPTRTGVRVVAAALGLFFFGFAGLLLTVDPTGTAPRGNAVLWYAALVAGFFGALFVALAVRGG